MPTPFDGYVQREAKVSSTCLVSVHRNRYSVPCEFAGQRVSTRLYPTRISVVAGDAVVASHERLSDRGHTSYDWQHYIDLVQRKPGALRNGAPFADMPEPLKKLKLGLMRQDGGDKVMAQVLAAVPTAGLQEVLVAVDKLKTGKNTYKRAITTIREFEAFSVVLIEENSARGSAELSNSGAPGGADGQSPGPTRRHARFEIYRQAIEKGHLQTIPLEGFALLRSITAPIRRSKSDFLVVPARRK